MSTVFTWFGGGSIPSRRKKKKNCFRLKTRVLTESFYYFSELTRSDSFKVSIDFMCLFNQKPITIIRSNKIESFMLLIITSNVLLNSGSRIVD